MGPARCFLADCIRGRLAVTRGARAEPLLRQSLACDLDGGCIIIRYQENFVGREHTLLWIAVHLVGNSRRGCQDLARWETPMGTPPSRSVSQALLALWGWGWLWFLSFGSSFRLRWLGRSARCRLHRSPAP